MKIFTKQSYGDKSEYSTQEDVSKQKTNFTQIFSLIMMGIIIGGGILLLLTILPVTIPPDSKSLLDLILVLIVLIAIILSSIMVGIACARILIIPISSVINSYILDIRNTLNNYSSRWPGRRFLDMLRYSRLAPLRRDFIALGLDTYFRVPMESDLASVNRFSSILYALESEANARGHQDIYMVAHGARNLLHKFINFSKLRSLIIYSIYLGIPCCLSYWLTRLITHCASYNWNNILSNNLPAFIHLPNFILSLIFFLMGLWSIYAIGQMLSLFMLSFATRTRTQIDDILMQVISWTIAGIIGIVLIYFSLQKFDAWPETLKSFARILKYLATPGSYAKILPTLPTESLESNFLNSLSSIRLFILRSSFIGFITAMSVLFLGSFCQRVLKQIALKTKQRYDDMVVELVRIFGTFILIAMGFGWIFMVGMAEYGAGAAGGAGGEFLPYAILVAVSGAILGIGSRDILENFFAGVALQIDKPFELGERVILESGEVCEVRSIGMRSTHFFNVIENTDLYIPNIKLAQETVTNLTRPDREHRRSTKFWVEGKEVKDEDETALILAESLILLAAFSVEGIDVPTVIDEQTEKSLFQKNRLGIAAEFTKLQNQYDEYANATIKFHGKNRPVGELVQNTCKELSACIQMLNEGRKKRWNNQLGKPVTKKEEGVKDKIRKEAELAHKTSYKFYELATCLYTLGAAYPTLRPDLEHLSLEILRAPSVRSAHKITEEGKSMWELEVMVYSYITEESEEIIHQLNTIIQFYLKLFDLLPE